MITRSGIGVGPLKVRIMGPCLSYKIHIIFLVVFMGLWVFPACHSSKGGSKSLEAWFCHARPFRISL